MSKKDTDSGVDPVTGRILETPEKKAEGLIALRAKMHATLAAGEIAKYPREDDQFLLPFLRARKYNIDKAHMVITNFAKFWYDPTHKEIIEGLNVERIKPLMNLGLMQMLAPYTDRKGNTLTALYQANLDGSKFNFKMQIEAALYFLAYVFEHEEVQMQGGTYVETFDGFSLMAAMGVSKAMSSKEQKELMNIFTDTFPLRIRDIWVIHQPWYFSVFWGLVKPFLSKKMTKRVHLLGSRIHELHEAVDPKNLPPAFGGTLDEPFDRCVRDMEALEKANGKIGGFAIPFSVEDPTGALRAAAAAAKTEGTVDISLTETSAATDYTGAAGAGTI